MLKNIFEKLKSRKLLVAIILVIFAANIFILVNTFTEKTTSTIWDGTIAKNFNSGDGTQENPYVINNGNELAYFFTIINGENYLEYFNKYYVVTNNIDLDGLDFSFASNDSKFSGYLDGQGYTISNFKISNYYLDQNGTYNYSLFSNLENANIENINFKDITIVAGSNIDVKKEDIVIDNNNDTINDTFDDSILNFTVEDIENSTVIENNETKIDEINEDNIIESNETSKNNITEETSNQTIESNETITEETNSTPVSGLFNYNVRKISTTNETISGEEKIVINASLITNTKESVIKNISVNNIQIEYPEDKNAILNSSTFILKDYDKNTIKNINVSGESDLDNTSILIYDYNNANVENIIYSNDKLDVINNYAEENETFFKYSFTEENAVFDEEIPIDSVLTVLNNDSNYTWTYSNDIFRLVNNGSDIEIIEEEKKIVNVKSGSTTGHTSGVEGSIVYVNNYESDYNYYMGLNYTTSTDGKTPSMESKNLYSDSNLVYLEIDYHGINYADKDSTASATNCGYVSSTERQNQYNYYIVTPVISDTDGQQIVRVNLIDNPFSDKPTSKVFNGWVTDVTTAKIKLNTQQYIRYIEIPITNYTSGIPDPIKIDVYATYTNGVINTISNSWSGAFNNISTGFVQIVNQSTTVRDIDMTNYSVSNLYTYGGSVGYYSYLSAGTYLKNGTYISSSTQCRRTGTVSLWESCDYYYKASGTYNSSTTYYELKNGSMTKFTVPQEEITTYGLVMPIGSSAAGYFEVINGKIPFGADQGLYYSMSNNKASRYSDGACGTSSGCGSGTIYKMLLPGEVIEQNKTYYYLSTRDTNIVYASGNISGSWTGQSNSSVPFTLTALNPSTHALSSSQWTIGSSSITTYDDVRIENIKIYSNTTMSSISNHTCGRILGCGEGLYYDSDDGYMFIGNNKNVKFGRGITRNGSSITFKSVIGSTTSSPGNSVQKYSLIIESGYYHMLSMVDQSSDSTTTENYYINAVGTYGSDYDRVANNNSNMIVGYSAAGTWGGNVYSSTNTATSYTTKALSVYVKSGTYGKEYVNYTSGIYAGARGGFKYTGTFTGTRWKGASMETQSEVIIEGGSISNVMSGPSSKGNNASYNDGHIYVKGGEIDFIFGGTGKNDSSCNKIIQMTGGIVNYSIFGGSNGSTSSSSQGIFYSTDESSTINGDTYIYVGGNSTVGKDNTSTYSDFDAEAGSIFGSANGKSDDTDIGDVNNVNIVIDGSAHILKNIYGGANYGKTGSTSSGNHTVNIDIHGTPTIDGSIYGGGNKNGVGTSSITDNVTINVYSSNSIGNIYGGSNVKGTVYGNTILNIEGGTVSDSAYGGGEGQNTFVNGNVTINVSNESNTNIKGSVYGGSAYGIVNSSSTPSAYNSSKSVTVNVSGGKIDNSVFGGAKGSSSITPYISGKITVNVSGGTIGNVFGGFDTKGMPFSSSEPTATVNISGGSITNVYGGGNKTNVYTSDVYVTGGTIENLFGGSNNSDNISSTTTQNLYISGGTITKAYGGCNTSGTCTTNNITVSGGTINTALYGGGKSVSSTTSNIYYQNTVNTVPNVFGGGESASVTTTNVNLQSVTTSNNINITNLYGGSDQTGSVTTANTTINKGIITNVYGGNNAGGTVGSTIIKLTNGTITNLYGGGQNAVTDNTSITMTNATVDYLHGGGYGADATVNQNTSITINSGTPKNVYGGGYSGNVTGNTTININRPGTTKTKVSYAYGGGREANVGGNTTVNFTNGSISKNLCGGGYGSTATVGGDTTVNMSGGTISSNLYGGGYNGSVSGNTTISLTGGTVNNVYGGGYKGVVSKSTNITLNGSIVQQYLYGGGYSGAVTISTNIAIYNDPSALPYVFGGGKKAGTAESYINVNTTTSTNNIEIQYLFGGSDQSGNVNSSHITINTGIIDYVYGGNRTGGKTSATYTTINDVRSITTLYGGGQNAKTDNTQITIYNGTIGTIYGGGEGATATINENTNILLESGTITDIYGGGNLGAVTKGTYLTLKSSINKLNNVFGGGNQAGAKTTTISMPVSGSGSFSTTNLYGGSNQSGNIDSSTITVNGGNADYLFGGNNSGGVTQITNITIGGGSISEELYGGGNSASVNNTNVTMQSGIVELLYGGSNSSSVTNDVTVTITGGTIATNLFGGGNQGVVNGNITVLLNGANISGSAYGGGNQSAATVKGTTYISVGGSTIIGSLTCSTEDETLSSCSLYGGGNQADVGIVNVDTSSTAINIAGGTIYGNIYGGSNSAQVHGTADITIGKDVITSSTLTKNAIDIKGTIYGGGDRSAVEDTSYNWQYESITVGIDININGEDYTINIDGSIFGSGNKADAGEGHIYIKNFGEFKNPKKATSIQRANLLVVDNSAIELSGAVDSTNDYSTKLFTISRIDEFDLKNNSSMYLQNGTNLLKSYKSLTSNDNEVESVTINTTTGTITRNVDNRLYVIAGVNINIATEIEPIGHPGDVDGMTFFGLYKHNGDGSINVGMYDDYEIGEELSLSQTFTKGSYVFGKKKTNHDITVDGFYTNVYNEETSLNTVQVIDPQYEAPIDYTWNVGETTTLFEVDLIASKFATDGTYELKLSHFGDPNTTFKIVDADFSGLSPDLVLTDKNDIPRVANDDTLADTKMALSMETSNAGWLVNGKTTFRTDLGTDSNGIVGTTDYTGGNNSLVPSLLFTLNHSKDISSDADLGEISLQLYAVTQIDALTRLNRRLVITIKISRTLETDIKYEGSITAGRKYDLFTNTITNITDTSSISTYFSLYHEGTSIYGTNGNEFYRVIESNYILPVGTKLTLLDITDPDNVDYYYHVMTTEDVTDATDQILQGSYYYRFSMFEKMGAKNSGVYYDDAAKDIDYYDSTDQKSSEEFILIVDFDDANYEENFFDSNGQRLDCTLVLSMLDGSDSTRYGTRGPSKDNLKYSLYQNKEAEIQTSATLSSDKIYSGESITVDLLIDYTQDIEGADIIYDTHLFDSKLGAKISLINSEGNVVTGTSLLGLYYEIDGVKYYPGIDGTTRIKLADRVDSAEKWIFLNTSTSKVATGNYKLRIETFGSPDGIYYGLNTASMLELDIEIVSEIYGLDASISAEHMIIKSDSGFNVSGENNITYTFSYNSGLTNASINFKMYRRDYTTANSTEYELVDATEYFSNSFSSGEEEYEYKIINNPENNSTTTYTFTTKEDLVSGTYKMEFILYDDDHQIGTIEKYIIIK